ncbi:MAG TPA: hypothetical protein VFD59_13305 [Nocardioidaceae bacterium]|nr:hypothetical protein [Nocardioidaceae bacterium]
MISAEDFFAPSHGPLKQGDVLFAGVSRLVADDGFCPLPWESIETKVVIIDDARPDGMPMHLGTGPALVMVTSHDCHFDKEWNRRRSELIRQGRPAEDAEDEAERDATLDRTFNASPLVDASDVAGGRGNLMAGRVVGYLPVPAAPDSLVPEAVVDLTYRCTLDRLDVVRVACVTNEVRAQLRFALTRLDSLRAPQLGFEVESVLGRSIARVELAERNPLLVRLHLDDGTTVDLLQQPGEPGPGPARLGQ